MKKEFKLYIAIPSTHLWESKFGMSLLFLSNYLSAHPVPGYQSMHVRTHNKTGSLLPNMRNFMLRQALEIGATHLLFIDSDQTFPRDLVHRLMKHNKHVVAANIVTKSFLDCNPTARVKMPLDTKGTPVYTEHGDHSLQEVWRVGTGIMLVDLNLFKREQLRHRKHFFDVNWRDEIDDYVGEDWGFCELLQEAGVKIYIDHGVSWEVGHIGTHEYTHEMALATRETVQMMEKQNGAVCGG